LIVSDHLGSTSSAKVFAKHPVRGDLAEQLTAEGPRRGKVFCYNIHMERYRIVKDVGLYYVTFSVVDWLPVFIDETACKIITESFNFCVTNKHLGVNAYLIMPTHLHAILFDVDFDSERLKHTLDDMRKFTGRQLLDHADAHLPKNFAEVFRQHAGKDRQRRFWQSTQHPVGIYSEGFWKQKMDYLHHNPCRKGLVHRPEDWRFSSALFWSTREPNEVRLSDVGWE
jgi:putative transposase